MRTSMPHSFRRRLFVAFLAVSLVPLLLCSAMLLQIFRLRMTDAAQAEAAGYLTGAAHILDTTYEELSKAASQIRGDRVFVQIGAGHSGYPGVQPPVQRHPGEPKLCPL